MTSHGFWRAWVRTTAAGVLVGTLVLGVGGRLLMRLVALARGASGGFSLEGSIEIVVAGAIVGGLAGAGYPFLPSRLGRWRPLVHAGIVFGVMAATSVSARGAAAAIPGSARLLALAAFAALMVVFSYALARVAGSSDARQ